jgi:hypothetical protein
MHCTVDRHEQNLGHRVKSFKFEFRIFNSIPTLLVTIFTLFGGLNGAVFNVADCYPGVPEVLGSIPTCKRG